jgi:MFS family permease
MIKKTIYCYLALRACFEFSISCLVATYVVYLIQRGGLNLLQVNLVNLAFFITLMVFEIPTGAIADIFGRRLSYGLAGCAYGLSSLVYASSHTFWGFVLGEVFGAVGSTFANGALQAWMIDRIKHYGDARSCGHIFAKEQYCNGFARMAGVMLGAYFADIDLVLPWLIGGIGILFIALTAMFVMKEEYAVPKKHSWCENARKFRQMLGTVRKHARENNVVRFLLVIGFVNMLTVSAPNMQWQPFFLPHLPNKVYLGYIFVANIVAMMFGAFLATKVLHQYFGERRALLVGQLVVGLSVGVTTFFGFPLALTFFLLHEIGRGAWYPLRDMYLHNNVPSASRASLASLASTFSHIGGMVGLLFSGFVAQYLSINTAWVLSGGVMVGAVVWLWRNGKK